MHRSSKSFSFLLEFILVVLFFSISSVVCVSLQSQASLMNKKANDTKMALQLVQNYMSDPRVSVSYDENGNVSEVGYFEIVEEDEQVLVVVGDEVLVCLPWDGGYEERE